jgi:hypothetical protein
MLSNMRMLGWLSITAVSVACKLAETPRVGMTNGAADAGRTTFDDADDGSMTLDATDAAISVRDADLERQQPREAVGDDPPVPGAKLVVRYHWPRYQPSIHVECYWQLPDGGVMGVDINTPCGI